MPAHWTDPDPTPNPQRFATEDAHRARFDRLAAIATDRERSLLTVGQRMVDLESMLDLLPVVDAEVVLRAAVRDYVAARQRPGRDGHGSFLRTLRECVDLWLSSTVDADAEAEDATATTRAMQ